MSLWDRITSMMAAAPHDHQPVLETRTVPTEGSLNDFIARLNGIRERPWRVSGVPEAMAVPSIFRAVTLISNVTGSLSMLAYRNGVELQDTDRPRLIIRPNPFTTPREFYRESAYSMATRGEAWWWIAMRDFDGVPMSLIPVNPVEIIVTENEKDLRFPIIEWRGKKMPNESMVQIKMSGEPGSLRGRGPLQVCGAAVSLAVEAQEWAANFYATGGMPSLLVKMSMAMSPEDAANLKAQWAEAPNNVPRFVDPGVEEVKEFGEHVQSSQMLQARMANDINDARMFGIPGPLLDAVQSGSSITYQNREGLWGEFLERCLLPDYLEPIEQAMSDLLTRSTVARFNTKGLLRADIKTRFEVHTAAIAAGIYDAAQAGKEEGYAPGDIENEPMPLSPPQAIPASLPIQTRSMAEVRCAECRRKLGMLAAPFEVVCPRCKTMNSAQDVPVLETRVIEAPNHEPELIAMRAQLAALAMRRDPEPVDLSPIYNELMLIRTMPREEREPVVVNFPPPPDPVDLSPIHDELLMLRTAMSAQRDPVVVNNHPPDITVPQAEVTVNTPPLDITPMAEAMDRNTGALQSMLDRFKQAPIVIPPQPPAVINLPPMEVNVRAEPAPIQNIRIVDMPTRQSRSVKKVKRDRNGLISEVVEQTVDE